MQYGARFQQQQMLLTQQHDIFRAMAMAHQPQPQKQIQQRR
jgi:hypothetical protein